MPPRSAPRPRDALLRVLSCLVLAACAGVTGPRIPGRCPTGTSPVHEGALTWCATPSGVWHGPSWRRDEAGRLRAFGTGRHGRTEGPFWTFHPNGRPAAEAWFAKDELTGPYRAWDAEGTLRVEGGHDARGQMHGLWRRFGPEGELRLEWRMEHGLHEGPTRAWHPDGALRMEGRHEAGRREGPWIWWTPEGEARARCVYAQGRVVEGRCPGPPPPPSR